MIIKHKNKNLGDSLATPTDVFKKCCNIWNLIPSVDVCATKVNSKCKWYIDEETNALKVAWSLENSKLARHDKNSDLKNYTVWVNPPHTKTKEFVKSAYLFWKNYNSNVIMLIPINCMTANYFKEFALPYIEFKKEMILSRIRFLDPITNQLSKYNSVNGYVTICFRKR